MAQWHLPQEMVLWITAMSATLDARQTARLLALMTGVLFARGRRTVASWLRGGGLQDDYKSYYYFLGSLGRKIRYVGSALLSKALPVVPTGERILLAIDDTPTKRYGEWVEGAGIHHNPTPGPADQKFVYGHVWVTLALVVRHGLWGTIGLPLWALLYVREKDIGPLRTWYGVRFRTKLEMAGELLKWAVSWLNHLGRSLWVVADGAYAKRPFLQSAKELGVTVVSRLRKDAALLSLPKPKKPGQRGPQATYGTAAFDLAKRAGHKEGWQKDTFTLYGKEQPKKYKTFLATYQPAGGVIRVVLVKERKSWLAFFCTDPEATVAQILEAVADRAALEQVFHDIKEVHGAGQQQLRNYWANVAAFNMNLWMHTLIELWAWNQSQEELADRTASPWDDPARRPSHADRRNALRRQCLEKEFPHDDLDGAMPERFQKLWNQMVALAA
jgi:DDE superfamily endonuclease